MFALRYNPAIGIWCRELVVRMDGYIERIPGRRRGIHRARQHGHTTGDQVGRRTPLARGGRDDRAGGAETGGQVRAAGMEVPGADTAKRATEVAIPRLAGMARGGQAVERSMGWLCIWG